MGCPAGSDKSNSHRHDWRHTAQRRNGPECEMRNAGTKTDRDRVRTAEQLKASVAGVLGLSGLAPDVDAVRCRRAVL